MIADLFIISHPIAYAIALIPFKLRTVRVVGVCRFSSETKNLSHFDDTLNSFIAYLLLCCVLYYYFFSRYDLVYDGSMVVHLSIALKTDS